tara:strand:+ start:1451 stop:1597 length:147 start_codon:yes stop_codon:yes gene_type:complete
MPAYFRPRPARLCRKILKKTKWRGRRRAIESPVFIQENAAMALKNGNR